MKIKICGLTTAQDAQYLNDNNVDFAGFVLFFPKSKRCISIQQAQTIFAALSPKILKVAVVVSPNIDEVRTIEKAGFDYIQIHGNLPKTLLSQIKIPVLRAFNTSNIDEFDQYRSSPQVAGYVFDAQEPGSGETFDWNTLDHLPRDEKIMFLAGGLTPENVASAVKIVQPDAVDVSSGVENADGIGKDGSKIKAFVTNVRKND